jgi:hypothetical protein
LFIYKRRYELKLEDKTCLNVAVKGALDIIKDKWGENCSGIACQIIVVIDGRANSNYLSNFEIPNFVKFHFITFGTSQESESDTWRILANKTYGSFSFIEIPQNAHLFNHSFDNLINLHCIHFIYIII